MNVPTSKISPMHVTIIALGSRGDVTSYAVFGGALRRAGHQVRLATMQGFAGLAERYDLDFFPLPGDAQTLVQTTATAGGLAGKQNILRLWAGIRNSYGALAHAWAESFSASELLETDIYINQLPGGLFGWDLAEKSGRPMLVAAVIPLAFTRKAPVMGFPALRLPGYNAISYRLAEQLVWSFFGPVVNRWRASHLGLPPHPRGGYFAALRRSTPFLNGFSPLVVPPPPDWGPHIHTTGYWLPEQGDWQPPEALLRFLESGSPPVFIGFGSMPVPDPAQTTKTLVEALRRTGQRGLLHAGWAGLAQENLPEHIFKIDDAPYDWLFPRMGMVIHHGGSGTTAFGLRSGVPSQVVSFTYDQPFWGRRIAALGAGPPPVPFDRLSAGILADSIQRSLNDPHMHLRAQQISAQLRQEDGLTNAVRLVERYASRND
jgi:sterol 3beta-glucosyltransferase